MLLSIVSLVVAGQLAKVEPVYAPLRFTRAVQVAWMGPRLAVVEQDGLLRTFDPANPKAGTETVLDIRKQVLGPDDDSFSEQGFLGVAVHPKFKDNSVVIVNYTRQPDGATVVSRFALRGKNPVEEKLLVIDQPYANHNGGGVLFGPDGKLYIGMGDGGSAGDPKNRAQDGGSLLGKFLRIDVDAAPAPGLAYAIPKDNPFVGDDGIRDEIWALGLRNPWRFAFDAKTGALWAGDVGQNLYEEVSVVEKGANLGWRCKEGFHAFKMDETCKGRKLVEPVAEYDHTEGVSVTGGVVIRGGSLKSLDGAYVYGDYGTGRIWAVRQNEKAQKLVDSRLNPSSFGVDRDGEVLVVAYDSAGVPLYRLVAL